MAEMGQTFRKIQNSVRAGGEGRRNTGEHANIFHGRRGRLHLRSLDQKKYSPVKDKFEGDFVKRRNVIFERAKFNMLKQEEGEPVDAFTTDLYSLAKHCAYGTLHNEMIHD